jgi:hypothetical protein
MPTPAVRGWFRPRTGLRLGGQLQSGRDSKAPASMSTMAPGPPASDWPSPEPEEGLPIKSRGSSARLGLPAVAACYDRVGSHRARGI